MTEERGAESGDQGESASDGLDAWMAANFPPPKPEQARPEQEQPEDPRPEPPSEPEQPRQPEPPAFPPLAAELQGVPPAAEFPPPPANVFADAPATSGIDALFGESNFLEYQEGIAASESPFARRPVEQLTAQDVESQPGDDGRKSQKVLLWVAGSLVALLALIALFVVGTKLPALLGPAPGSLVAAVETPTPTPTATELPLGPVEPGEYLWDELLGGECIAPYSGPWQTKYTVVSCEEPHPAQLVTRGTFAPQEGSTGFPGIEALQSQVNLLCTAATVVDYAKADAYTNIQFEASYAISSQDWADGNHSYYCFLSRSDGGDVTGTIAMPQVAPSPPADE